TITLMNAGTLPGGPGEFPGLVVHCAPQAGWETREPKPLKAVGALPPESLFCEAHCEPQNVTLPVADLSPTANIPPAGASYTNACELTDALWYVESPAKLTVTNCEPSGAAAVTAHCPTPVELVVAVHVVLPRAKRSERPEIADEPSISVALSVT